MAFGKADSDQSKVAVSILHLIIAMKPIQIDPLAYHVRHEIWSLLKDEDGDLYLLVSCEASVVSYECLLKLNEDERKDFHGLGWLSLQHLAHRVNYFSRDYSPRMIQGAKLDEAIRRTAPS